LDNKQRFAIWLNSINGAVSVLRGAFPWVAVIFLGAYARDVLVAFAGHDTNAEVGLKLIASIKLDRWLAYIVAVMGGSYGLRQRHLRRKAIERTTERPIELERLMDPGRTSSKLTTQGTTRREDR